MIVLGVLVAGVAFGGLLWWGHSKKLEEFGKDDPIGPTPERIVLFPELRVGSIVMVDGRAANLTQDDRLVRAAVDMILSDKALVSVVALDAALIGVRGTIPRSSIRRVEPSLSGPPLFET